MVDIAPFPLIIVTHDKFNLHDGKKINLVQLELARFVIPFRGVRNRVKTKKPQGSLSALAVQIVFYLIANYVRTMLYRRPFVKVYYPCIGEIVANVPHALKSNLSNKQPGLPHEILTSIP